MTDVVSLLRQKVTKVAEKIEESYENMHIVFLNIIHLYHLISK